MSAPLDGIRVLDLTSGIAGPLAGMLLADFGADVVKVEPPAGDPARTLPGFAVWNRNKRGIVIDSSSSSGRSRLEEFLAGADVCIVSHGDPNHFSAKYPRLVVVHMPPYAPNHTPWSGEAESHALLSAFGGAAWRQSSFDGGPIDLVYPFPLYVQGHWAAGATVAALIERLRSNTGQVVTVAGMHGLMVSCVGQLNIVPSQAGLPTNVGPGGRHPCYTTYQAGDGQWLFMAALTPKFQTNAFKVLEVGDIFADERIHGIPARMLLPENRTWIRQRLADAFRTHSRDEWLARLEQGDCPAGPVCDRDGWLDHPQLCANSLRVEIEDPQRGRVVMPGVPLVMTQTPGAVVRPAPTLGQHDAEVVPWPAQPAARSIAAAPARRGPLEGYRVLDLGTILAGPYAGALLAELGADVIKVEAPTGDPFRETGFVYNRGQRGLAIDLTSEAARQGFYAVVRNADVVLDNARLGVLQRLHIDYASLQRVKPDIVTLSVNGFGEAGPAAAKPGFDPVLQAMSGMMAAQGGDCDPVLFTIPINDIAAGTVSVLGVCLGLFHRERCGVGQRIWTSLLGCSASMQSGELVRFEGRSPAIFGARDFGGPSGLDRFYQVKDGWVRLQTADAKSLRVAGILGVESPPHADVTTELSHWFGARSASEALASLSGVGVPAVVARLPGELTTDADLAELDMFATQHMQDGTPFFTTNRYALFGRTPQTAVFTPPGIGEHSREVLAEAGVDAAEIDALVDAGAVRQGQPFTVVAIQNYR